MMCRKTSHQLVGKAERCQKKMREVQKNRREGVWRTCPSQTALKWEPSGPLMYRQLPIGLNAGRTVAPVISVESTVVIVWMAKLPGATEPFPRHSWRRYHDDKIRIWQWDVSYHLCVTWVIWRPYDIDITNFQLGRLSQVLLMLRRKGVCFGIWL